MSEYSKDVLALVISTVLVTLVWLAIGTYRLSSDTELDSRSAEFRPVSAVEAVNVGLER
jgi:hypothetical protein